MPSIITVFYPMTFVCKWHTECELEVFQPVNSVAYVGKCIKCEQEQDRRLNELAMKIVDKAIEAEEKKVKAKRKPNLCLNGIKTKHNLKKGGKK